MDIQTIITVVGFAVMLGERLISAGKIIAKVETIEKNQNSFQIDMREKLLKELEDKYFSPIESLGVRVKNLEAQTEKLFAIITGIQTNFGKVMDALKRNQNNRVARK